MTTTDTGLAGTLLERRYRVDTPIARGGMSSVYRGADTRLDRPVAIKIMDPRFADDRSFVERFEREARSAAKLHHPNVVTVHDQGVDGPHVFLVMELVDGGTLRDLLDDRGALDVALALSVTEQMLAALAAAHAAGLVHRDVKPENVLIGRTGTPPTGVVKVADFGLVRAVASSGTTSSSIILGTVAYLSPEQVTTGLAEERGDVYSAGIVLYEMLTGRVPYTGDTAISVAYRHVNDDVPAPSAVNPQVPAALDDLVLRATRRDPEARPADAAAFLRELRQIRASLGLGPVAIPVPPGKDDQVPDAEKTIPAFSAVGPTSPVSGPRGTRAMLRPDATRVTGMGQVPPPVPPSAAPAEPPPERDRNRKIALWSIAAVVLVAIIGGGLWWFTTGEPASRTAAVPQVSGMDQATATETLRTNGFTAKVTQQRNNTVAAGLAVRTDPAGGSTALKGSEVTLVISSGKPTVPDISSDTSLQQAETAIIAAQLVPAHDANADQYSTSVPSGNVVSVNPQPGTQLDVNATVTIIVSKGPPPQPIPDVTGMSHDQAFQTLQAAGFQPFDAGAEFSEKVSAGNVTRTDPKAGANPSSGTQVGVFVSNSVEVPSVIGHTIQDAVQTLQAAGLQVEGKARGNGNGNNGFGLVIQQDPEPGKLVKKGSKVNLKTFP
ncbi:Stk1 family PASTA domain-containing Ser/Thr kinase [Amycolatopsis acidicola]|uniref:non-specific serine/threonine protein kinase n=1 Tax=Amycolatopsis acidicola TaxID=2596893 RepID=A0A5N0V0J6_9PSEU|nr:Stk1 family PASTA domain-containing Ser/Thr kinase [Amycolatopsis acidicola]KAA9159997.1 Stk1 family PASTA domain-containing Ser/Thr kinase [Amycolatopsis acidicola]